MRHVNLVVCICCTSISESPSDVSVTRTHVHVRTPPSITRGSSGEHGRARGGRRASTSRRPVAFGSDGKGWSWEGRRTEPGSAGEYHRKRRGDAEVDETNLPQAPPSPSPNWIPTCGGWGDRAGTAGEVPAFGSCRGGSCLLPVLRWEGVASGENADGGGDCRRTRAHFGGRVGTRAGEWNDVSFGSFAFAQSCTFFCT